MTTAAATCPLCEDPVLAEDATEEVLGMLTHAECAATERDLAAVKAALR